MFGLGDTPLRNARIVVLAVMAIGVSSAACATSSGESDPAEPMSSAASTTRIEYGDTPDNFGELYLPEGSDDNLPVVVMIHGGGWLEDHDLSYFQPLSASLAEEGVAVWNVEYRRVDGAGGWPVTLADVDDATEALATVVQEKADNRLDLDRVHLAGHSAGGHLAAWVAGRHTFPPGAPGEDPHIKPRSATIMAGVFDLSLAATSGHDVFVRNLLDGMPEDYPDRYQVASPIDHLPIGLPVTALHGDNDQTVSIDQSRNYTAAAVAAGDPAQLQVLPGTGHGDFGNPDGAAWAAAREAILGHVGTVD